MDLNPSGVYAPLADVFPGVSNDFTSFRSRVEQLSRTDTLFWCARLNLVLSNPANPDHKRTQASAIHTFFTADAIARINAFARVHPQVRVFFRGQLLELMRWVCLWCEDHPDDGVTFERPEVCHIFAQAALMASDLWACRVYGDRFSLEGGRDLAQRRALGAIRGAIADASPGMDPLLALGRGHDMFSKHLPPFYPDFAQEFAARTQLSLDEFYSCLAAFMTNFLNRTPENVRENPGIFNVNTVCASAPPHVQSLIAKYLARDSQTADELKSALWDRDDVTSSEEAAHYNHKPFRQRPILRASDGRAIILDPVFYADRAATGPLLVQIADACLNDVAEASLFEMKAVWVPDEVILEDDYERYLDRLRDRYGVRRGKRGRRSVKGVGQLARTITNLASGEWTPLTQDFTRVQRLYPVLLVHDTLLDAPVHGKFLAAEFAQVLAPDTVEWTGEMRKGRFRVAPLIVMTIDDLEALETSIEHFSLHGLLRDYSAACMDLVASLHNYLAVSEYRTQIYHSRSMAANSLEVLEQSRRTIFPNTIDLQDEGKE